MCFFLPCLAVLILSTSLIASTPAEHAWFQGQQAMDNDRLQEAIGHFQLALRLDPKLTQAHLSLAAAHLALGAEAKAMPHMVAYLRANPSHYLIRLHYGDLLFRSGQHSEARQELEQVVRDIQSQQRQSEDHLIGCHTRLMEIAQQLGDDYGERLNRGIGLYFLARKRGDLGDEASRRAAEELFIRAAGELTMVRRQHPDEARPCWYLHHVWSQLGQRQPASRWLRVAWRIAPFSSLTPVEKRDLYLTGESLEADSSRR